MTNFKDQQVFAAELERINQRRHHKIENPQSAEPNTKIGLTGLAFSGGGIRSATLNLGILQAMHNRGALENIDYLSTVSGGGYIGSSLSASLSRDPEFPYSVEPDGYESLALKHLRTNGNYLAAGGLLAYLRIPVLLLRGWIVNTLVILPYLLLAVVLTVVIAGDSVLRALQRHAAAQVSVALPSDRTVDVVPIDLDAALRSNQPLVSRHARILKYRSANFARIPRCDAADDAASNFVITTPSLILDKLPPGVKPESDFGTVIPVLGASRTWIVSHAPDWKAPVSQGGSCIERPAPLAGTASASALNVRLSLDDSAPGTFDFNVYACDSCMENGRLNSSTALGRVAIARDDGGLRAHILPIARKLGLLLLLAIALYPIAQFLLARNSSLQTRDRATRMLGLLLVLIIGAAILEIQPLAIYEFGIWSGVLQDTPLLGQANAGDALSASLLTLTGFLVTFARRISAASEGIPKNLGIIALGTLAPLTLWLVYLNLSYWAILPRWQLDGLFGLEAIFVQILDWAHGVNGFDNLTGYRAQTAAILTYYAMIALVLFVYGMAFVDVNRTSLHRFYRDRLSEAYLRDPDPAARAEVDTNESLQLQAIDTKVAPYHLVNCAMNLPPNRTIDDRGRGAVPFVFSPEFTGSERTGYCRTSTIHGVDSHIDLGTAMAISGAAASPRMGNTTIRPLAFIMALLNVRLGYWCPNPRFLLDAQKATSFSARLRRLLSRPGPVKLLKEMLGLLSDRDVYVNVSDGGHIENLAIYELLRRRCALIVACDAEADPDLTFAGLANLIRQARIDFGITIDIDVDDLRWDRALQPPMSRSHYAIGRITYPDPDCPPGQLLYLKSTVLGTESEDIFKYRADHPSFPHETTADQFFDEAQFESYRALGFAIGSDEFDIGNDTNAHLPANVLELLIKLNPSLDAN